MAGNRLELTDLIRTRYVVATVPNTPTVEGESILFNGNVGGTGTVLADRVELDVRGTALNFSGDFTYEFWLYAGAENTAGAISQGANYNAINGNIFLDRDVYSGPNGHVIALADGRVAFGVNGTSAYTVVGTADVRGGWSYGEISRDSTTGEMWIFMNGQLDGSGTGPTGSIAYPDGVAPGFYNSTGGVRGRGGLDTDHLLVLGAEKHDADPALYPSYYGLIADFRASNVVRNTSNYTPPTSRLTADANTVALYPFNGTVEDAAGSLDLTLNISSENYPQFSLETPFTLAWAAVDTQFVDRDNAFPQYIENFAATYLSGEPKVVTLENVLTDIISYDQARDRIAVRWDPGSDVVDGVTAKAWEQSDLDADWASRVSQPGVLQSMDFDYPNLSAFLTAETSSAGWAYQSNMALTNEHGLSGKSFRQILRPTDAQPSIGSFHYLNGTDSTVYQDFWVALVVWGDEWFRWNHWRSDQETTAAPKIIIIDQFDDTSTTGEVVIDNAGGSVGPAGFPTAYTQHGSFKYFCQRPQTTPSFSNFTLQSSVNNALPALPTTEAQAQLKYGPLWQGLDHSRVEGTFWGTLPDAEASLGGVPWNCGGHTFLAIHVDYAADRVDVYAASFGHRPKLISSTEDAGGSGPWVNPRPKGGFDGFNLTTFRTFGAAEAGRPEMYLDYCQLQVSTQAPMAPGGYTGWA